MRIGFILRLRLKLRKLLQLNCPPSKLALASAVGVVIGVSPYVGLHTGLAIVISFVFNLPVYPLMLGAYITNPLTFIPIYALCYKLGTILIGSEYIPNINWHDIHLSDLIAAAKSIMLPLIIGSHAAGLVLAIFTYFVIYYIVKAYRVGL